MTDILMPALSPTMEEGTLAKWLVKVGDAVEAGQVIAEIETDKATMEVEAVDEGTVAEILVEAGEEGVKVNAVIARLRGEGEATLAPPTAVADAPTATSPSDDGEETPQGVSSSREAGGGGASASARSDGGASGAAAPPPAAPSQAGGETGASHAAPPVAAGERVAASPLARRLAQAAGLDLRALTGSGPHGRIIKRDVDAARGKVATDPPPPGEVAAKPTKGASPPTASVEPPPALRATSPGGGGSKTLEELGIPPGSYDLIPLDGMGRTIARRMTDSFRDVPHFPLTVDLEIDRLLEARGRINALLEKQGVKASVNDLVLKAVAVALRQVPEANASYSPERIARHHHADVAFAVALEHGLITPIIRAAETKGLAQIAREAKDLAERARTKKLKPEEFQGGTFTVSNLGMMGIKSFASIINEPQGCILSVGAGEQRAVVRAGQLAVATVMTVTLTCDHRVVDGAIGARFLQAFKALLEDPLTMIV